ncbi:hypothetical protein CAOG_05318 [Capsaspora owczarzaki ATCC 30864]|uniref:hypothetical protein n=1 Tax=Capsaspora owczarzaki (strain ATCC 30864) TaxID=595528 RepID=UPI00035218DA|nr:hypothetical protein CAOG_05318 [Capsaspora owczarzaki ATCC 30864]|eukprot:XP_004347003.2 hypothetical protein CAOG_05318 [Capsaspora owczarzaki ATCC 30864]
MDLNGSSASVLAVDAADFLHPQFSAKQWVNDVLRRAHPASSSSSASSATTTQSQTGQRSSSSSSSSSSVTDDGNEISQTASALVVKLQLLMQDVSASLEDAGQRVIQAMPRTLRDIDTIRVEAIALRERMGTVASDLQAVESGTYASMKVLLEVDAVRDRMEAATVSLRQAGTWATLAAEVDTMLTSGDVAAVRQHLHEMRLCLSSMGADKSWQTASGATAGSSAATPSKPAAAAAEKQDAAQKAELDGKRALMRSCEDRFEARIAPRLFQALNSHDEAETKLYLDCFEQMGRVAQFESYYARCHAASVHRFWKPAATAPGQGGAQAGAATPMTEWYPLFLDELYSVIKTELGWCVQVFPLDRAIAFVTALVVASLSGLTYPSLTAALPQAQQLASGSALPAQSPVIDLLILLRAAHTTATDLAAAFNSAISTGLHTLHSNPDQLVSHRLAGSASLSTPVLSPSISSTVDADNSTSIIGGDNAAARCAPARLLRPEKQREISRLLLTPFDKLRDEAIALERQYLLACLNSIVKFDPPTLATCHDHIRHLGDAIPRVFVLAEQAVTRCVELTSGSGVPELGRAITTLVGALVSKITTAVSQYRALGRLDTPQQQASHAANGPGSTAQSRSASPAALTPSAAASLDKDDEWGMFQAAIKVLQVCGDIIERLNGLDDGLVFAALDHIPALLEAAAAMRGGSKDGQSASSSSSVTAAGAGASSVATPPVNRGVSQQMVPSTPDDVDSGVSFTLHCHLSEPQQRELSSWMATLVQNVRNQKERSTQAENSNSSVAALLVHPQVIGDALAEALSLTNRTHALAVDCIFAFIDRRLVNLRNVRFSSTAPSGVLVTDAAPSFSLSPLDYITQIGEHFLALPVQLEPLVNPDNKPLLVALAHGALPDAYSKSLLQHRQLHPSPSGEDAPALPFAEQWLTAVALVAMDALARRYSELPRLSPNDVRQIATDIDYLSNVLSALDVTLTPTLAYVRQLFGAPAEKFKSLQAEKPVGCDPSIHTKIASIRGIVL